MNVECPQCHGQFDFAPEFIGRQVRCSGCGNVFEVTNPKLFPCPDCYVMISRRASVCPQCGAVLASQPKNLPSADLSKEKEIEIYHPSAMNYLWGIVLGVVTLPILIGVFILLFILIEIKCTSYKLTTHRIIVRRGWVAKMQNEIWIKDMRAVNLEQGVWQRIIGVGNIAIGTAASAGTEISIVGIAAPAEVVEKINSLRNS